LVKKKTKEKTVKETVKLEKVRPVELTIGFSDMDLSNLLAGKQLKMKIKEHQVNGLVFKRAK